MPDNVLRVGAEFDVAPLIAGTQAAGNAFEEMKAKLVSLAAQAEASGSVMTAQAARLMASGLNAKEAASALENLGVSEKEAASAADVAARAVGLAGIAAQEHAEAANSATESNTRLAASFREVAVSAQSSVNGSAAARVELGALSGSVGAAEFGLARIAGQSKLLGPLIQAAFVPFAILAFIEILAQGIAKLEEWADAAQKSADANAAFSREMLKSVEAVDQAKEKLAGLAGQAASGALELAHLGDKSADVSEDVKKLNERLADQPGIFKSIEGAIGTTAVGAFHLFDDAAERAEHSNETFNRQLADTVKQSKDLPSALEAVNAKIRELQTTFDNPALAAYSETTQENLQRQISLYQEWAAKISNVIEAQGIDAKVLTEKNAKEILDSDQKLATDRIALEEQEADASLRLNMTTAEQTRDVLLRLSDEKLRITEEGIAREQALLNAQKVAQPGVDFGAAQRDISDRAAEAEIRSREERLRIATTTDEEIKRRDLERAEADISSSQMEIEAADRASEAYRRMILAHAQTPAAVNTASIDLERALVKVYDDQITALKLKAEALKESDAVGNANAIKELAAQEIALDAEKETAIRTLHEETAEKIREMDRKSLQDQIEAYNDQLGVLKGKYAEDVAAHQASLNERRVHLGAYVAQSEVLAEQELQATIAVLERESEAVREAAAQRIISEQDASRQLSTIWKQEAEAFDLEQKRMEQAAKQAAQKEEQEIKAVSTTIARDFTQAFNQVITGHEKVGQAALKLGAQLELYIIDQGIKKVVTAYSTDLLQMIAAHSSFLANLLGIQTASDAEQAAQAKVLQTQIVTFEAGESYAAAFASVMAALPFPANVSAAPAIASAAMAQTLAGLSFEYGGVIPGPVGSSVPIIAHGQEGVLNEKVTSLVNNSNSSSSSSAPTTINMGDNHFYKTSDMTEAAIARNFARGVKRGTITLGRK